jgi:hypothetical protein
MVISFLSRAQTVAVRSRSGYNSSTSAPALARAGPYAAPMSIAKFHDGIGMTENRRAIGGSQQNASGVEVFQLCSLILKR